jgi:hypothetical protein
MKVFELIVKIFNVFFVDVKLGHSNYGPVTLIPTLS